MIILRSLQNGRSLAASCSSSLPTSKFLVSTFQKEMTFCRCRYIMKKSSTAAGKTQTNSFLSKFKPAPPRTTHEKNLTTFYYLCSMAVLTVGAAYAAVPLYRAFCQSTGYGGTVKDGHDTEKVETMEKNEERLLTIRFNSDTAASMRWNFKPQQPVVYVYPGETALAFYTARNPTDKPVDGVSTYNVIPFEAGPYFNKIQCFCFEEQRLNPGEEVDMPVFFYIDPEFLEDPFLENCKEITLSYTFFESKPGMKLPTYNPGVRYN
eukprot:TRINITY_DN187_c0_g1_i1.p1 TRINITY_DN187_c0_g1~~TRINITY_DN187_c0_g1_i1.p1  ORF type:complete len:264 (-),score=55.40 TRINITY_DN187_c0_g1_i1:253-1044(-)